MPEIKKAFLTTKATSSVLLKVFTILGRLWWNIREKTLLEKIYTKLEILKTPWPFGTISLMPSRQKRKTAPKIKNKIERTLIPMMMACITLVLSILLKLKAAPAIKNKKIQKLKFCKIFAYSIFWKARDITLPVIIHFDIEVPSKYIDIQMQGKMPHFLLNRISSWLAWSSCCWGYSCTLLASYAVKSCSSVVTNESTNESEF